MTIQVDHLSFAYDRQLVLNDVTAHAEQGTITTIIGPNAAGKSTLLRCIIGALKPKTGRVILDNEPVRGQSPRWLAQRVAYVPQRSIVSAAFTVLQVVEIGRYALAPNSSKVAQAIDGLNLSSVANRRYQELSVGQQQRVTLARAIAQLDTNGHLILDEPTSGMDLHHAAQCMQLLRDLAEHGATIVLAMHDLTVAASISENTWLLNEGRLIAEGATVDVLQLERLESVFNVKFQWVNAESQKRLLLPEIPI